MCPVCVAAAAQIVVGTISGGGLAAAMIKTFRVRSKTEASAGGGKKFKAVPTNSLPSLGIITRALRTVFEACLLRAVRYRFARRMPAWNPQRRRRNSESERARWQDPAP
jgi:hypothetical protein